MTLRQLWWMSQGHRESRRWLAGDVWRLMTDKKFDFQKYIRTGHIAIHKQHPLPQTPEMKKALEKAYREKERLEEARANRGK